jgi:hypothetical protein
MLSIVKSKVPYNELMDAFSKDAPLFNESGVTWKIWLENKEGLIGGIYYFKSQEDFEKHPTPELMKKVIGHQMVERVSSHVFDVIEDLSLVNNAPI